MEFVGKLAYLVLFPGMLFIILAGTAARSVISGVGNAVAGSQKDLRLDGAGEMIGSARAENIATGGSLRAVTWIAPVFKVLALSWVSCIVFGFLPGDIVLVFILLLAAAGTDTLVALASENPRVRQGAWPEAASLMAWAVPFALVVACVALRTHEVSLRGIIAWQTANGVLIVAQAGGLIANVGAFLALIAGLISAVAIMRLRPLGRSYGRGGPGALMDDVSGPPLSFFIAGGLAMTFVVPLVLVALFFAGPAAHWYQVIFWALKAAGFLILLGLVDVLCARASSRRALVWGAGIAGALALAGLVLVWSGVTA